VLSSLRVRRLRGMIERAERGVSPLVAYTFAMAVRFLIVGYALGEEHGRAIGRVDGGRSRPAFWSAG
jgi:hypothetical protein